MSKVLIEQALNHLVNLQPVMSNGLLNKRQLASIDPHIDEAIGALRAALAQPGEEPVAWGVDWGVKGDRHCVSISKKRPDGVIEVVATEYGPHVSAQQPAPQPAQHPDARAAAIKACIERLIFGGQPAAAQMLRHHFAKDLEKKA